MAVDRLLSRARLAVLGLCLLGLAGCGALSGVSGGSAGAASEQSRNPFGALVRGVGTSLMPAEQPAPAGFTATRASLRAQGFNQPLLTAQSRAADGTQRKAGLLQTGTNNGTRLWQGSDGGGVTTRDGVVEGSVGLVQNAYGISAAPTLAALRAGGRAGYLKEWRHLDGLGQIRRTQMSCTLTSQGAETISVLGRAHATTRFREACAATGPGPLGEVLKVDNIYWRGVSDGVLWRSEQWISPQVGHLRLERVI